MLALDHARAEGWGLKREFQLLLTSEGVKQNSNAFNGITEVCLKITAIP